MCNISFSVIKNFKKSIVRMAAPLLSIWSLLWLRGIYIIRRGELFIATSFNRVFGNATLAGIDAQKRVNVMLFYNLLFTVLFFFITFLIIRWFLEQKDSYKTDEQASTKVLSLINSISICIIANHLILSINELNQLPLTLYAEQILIVMLVVSLIYYRFRFTTYEKFKWGLFTGLASALFVYFIIWNEIIGIWINRDFKLGVIYFVNLFALFFVLNKFNKIDFERLKTASIPLFYGTAFMAVFLELTNIMNQHGFYIVNRLRWAKIIYILLAIICLVIYFSKLHRKNNWENICYLGLIISIASFTQLPPLSISATTELFEQANHGMLTYSFFNSGSIPILESFDGHMLRYSFGGLIYGLLNGQGALGIDSSYFFYSFANLFNCIILFYLLKNIFSIEFSLFAVLFIPLNYSDFFVLTVVLLIYCIKKDTVGSYFLYLASIALAAFYELPPAVAVGIGSIITLLIILLPDVLRQKKLTISARRFLKAVCLFIISILCVYFLLCLFKQINPISRLLEILGLINSNNNWAYSNIGNQNHIVFNILYFILPVLITAALICILYKFKVNIKVNMAATVCVALFIGHFANYSRMLGRHSLAEGSNRIVFALQFTILPLALLTAIFAPKWKKWYFTFVVMGLPAIITFCINNNLSFGNSMMNYAMSTIENGNIYYKGNTEKTARVNYSYVLSTHSAVISMINAVVPSNETYMDLSSQTMLYALTGREKPVYINQSPLHLSGEYTQIAFINQINNYNGKCDFALLGGNWMNLDGLKNEYRYYKVYEYLNAEFVPLCQSSDGYELWVRKTRYNEINSILSGILNNIPQNKYSAKLSLLTDINWTNGILNDNHKVVLFKNTPLLRFAKSLRIEDKQDVDVCRVEIVGEFQYVTFETVETAEAVAAGSLITYTVPTVWPYIIEQSYDVSRHTYNLGYIPYLWGTFDSKKAYNNQIICELTTEGELPLDLLQTSNYIMLRLNSVNKRNTVQLSLSTRDGTLLVNYIFQTKSGERTYLIRPSSDNLWGTGIISRYSILIGDNINFKGAWLTVGD